MKRAGNCSNCARGISVKVNTDILCSIHGAVSRDYRCSRYKRKAAVWSVNAPSSRSVDMPGIKCNECEFFLIPDTSKDRDPTIGYCQLFTVRHYDGSTKNACSKFSKKADRNI